jgi:ABC-2 type transport system ATP-binding protein
MSIEVKRLTKTFGTQHAVNDISFEVHKGDILGFLGPNGAGKSTTMKIASGFMPPTSGRVSVAGLDVQKEPLEVKRRIGYLPEHNPLYLDMYVKEYLHFIGGLHGFKGAMLNDRVEDMVRLTGLDREQHKLIGALSKGYRQRVGLAQALLHDPEVLILDEPTSGLDPNQIVEIRELIKRVSESKTVILSTHIMQEVKAICNRAIVIHLGEIVADRSLKELSAGLGKSVLSVEFADDQVPASFFQGIEGLGKPVKTAPGKWSMDSTDPVQARARIFSKAASQQLNLIGLKEEEQSLESIFQQLTQAPKA